jgi:acyl-coenzyme A thioesterase PaaI-like protein
MNYKVINKQENSKNCLVCGLKNNYGLKASFYELENKNLLGVFKPLEEHQSYPGRLHGGIASAILDETIGRAILMNDRNVWGVTVELNLRYKKTIPLNEEIKVVGRITKDTSRIFEGTGEIILKNGDIAVTASGKYLKMPLNKIADFNFDEQEWKVSHMKNEPDEFEY